MNDPGSGAGRPRLVVDAGVRPWRDLGAVPWAVLCDLAASAAPDAHGWIAPVGARELGASAGLNKDTAARALAALAGAGIVTRERAEVVGARRRSGYRLRLPTGIGMCPTDPDGAPAWSCPNTGTCPSGSDPGMGPGNPDGGTRPVSPDSRPCPTGADAPGRPSPSDNGARRADGDCDRQVGDDRDADAPRDEGAGADFDVPARRSDDAGVRDVRHGASGHGPEGAAGPLNGRRGLAEHESRRPARAQVTPAVDEAQGQLFEASGGAADRGAQDGRR